MITSVLESRVHTDVDEVDVGCADRAHCGASVHRVEGDRIVCHCLQVRTSTIEAAVSAGAVETVKCVMDMTGAGGGCTACHRRIRDLIEQHAADRQVGETSPLVRIRAK